ncbi:hypothetical protein [Ekhidna sp.]
MKKLLIGILALSSLSIMAQPPVGLNFNEMVLREQENVMKIEGINWMQEELLEGIYKEYGQTIKETFEEIRKTRNFGEMRTKMSSLQEEKNLLVKDVLNNDQYQKYMAIAGRNPRGRQNQPDGQD